MWRSVVVILLNLHVACVAFQGEHAHWATLAAQKVAHNLQLSPVDTPDTEATLSTGIHFEFRTHASWTLDEARQYYLQAYDVILEEMRSLADAHPGAPFTVAIRYRPAELETVGTSMMVSSDGADAVVYSSISDETGEASVVHSETFAKTRFVVAKNPMAIQPLAARDWPTDDTDDESMFAPVDFEGPQPRPNPNPYGKLCRPGPSGITGTIYARF